jgi:hypothetical protein
VMTGSDGPDAGSPRSLGRPRRTSSCGQGRVVRLLAVRLRRRI